MVSMSDSKKSAISFMREMMISRICMSTVFSKCRIH